VEKMLAGIAHPWLCDSMGHLNTRHYVALFDDATHLLLTRIGYSYRLAPVTRLGWADVRNEIDYLHEVPRGSVVELYSGIVKLGTKSMTILSEMRDVETTQVHARMKAVLVYFDLQARAALPLTEEIRTRAAPLLLPADRTQP
jgi:acyl-CoA thioester hydrolase